MPKICSPHNPEPIARAFVQAVRGRLAALPFLPEVERIEVDIDLTPITSRIHGELRASSKGENNGRQVWISAFNFSDCWRTRLFPGFKFKLFQSKYR